MSEINPPGGTRNPGGLEHEELPARTDAADPGRPSSESNAHWLGNGIIGILTGIISGVLVAFYLSATGQAALTAVRHYLTKPTCSNPQWLLQVPDNQIFASAYYVQSDTIPGYGEYHVPSNTIDGDLATSWLQLWRSPTSNLHKGSSDYAEWTFPQRYDVRLICIVDGWTQDSITYKETLPIGTATAYVTNTEIAPPTGAPRPSAACPTRTQHFTDYLKKGGKLGFAYQWQPIEFHCLTNNVVLHIDSVSRNSIANRPILPRSQLKMPSGVYRGHLTGISEVRFYYCPTVLCMLPAN